MSRDMTLEQFAREAAGLGRQMADAVGKAGVRVIAARAKTVAKALTPVGGVGTRDKHPGKMKQSWETTTEGDNKITEGNTAPHAKVIDLGRRRSKKVMARPRATKRKSATPKEPKGKMLGSEQARRGVTRPTGRAIFKAKEDLTRRIVAEAEKEV